MRERLAELLNELRGDRRGVTALEYGLLAGVVAFALIAVLTTFSGDLAALFGRVDSDIATIATTAPHGG